MVRSYIGITGVTNRFEVQKISASFRMRQRSLMVGVLASQATVNGGTNKYPNRYPPHNRLGSIFTSHPRALNLVHYHSDDARSMGSQLKKVRNLAGDYCHGIQLNIVWPDISDLDCYLESYPDDNLVLQVGDRALSSLKDASIPLVEKLKDYRDKVQFVLFDMSGGKGLLLKPQDTLNSLREVINSDLGFKIVVAGGLGPGTLDLVLPIIESVPDISIDAESALRNEDDTLNLGRCAEYLLKAQSLFIG